MGPIDQPVNGKSRRALLQGATQLQPVPNAGTPLFEVILRANADMQARYRPEAPTLIVVLTDGKDEDSGYAMSREDFLGRLGAARDPAKKVPIHCIGYGADADMATLTEVAKATGGVAIPSADPADLASAIARLFLAARQAS
jgi:Mg-chelatase subunit ChlD